MDVNGQFFSWFFISLSNILWLFVFVPQLYKNYKTKKSEAISLLLLLCLILGDIFSLISGIAKGLNHTIIYTTIYHIILDIIIIFQIIYYRIYLILLNNQISENQELVPLFGPDYINQYEYSYFYLSFNEFLFLIINFCVVVISQVLLVVIDDNIILADIIAWFSTFIFIFARIPQIKLNFKRKSTEGLSFLSFVIINIANLLFLTSILIMLIDIPTELQYAYIRKNIQWIFGSFSTTFFDLIIFYQFYKFRNS